MSWRPKKWDNPYYKQAAGIIKIVGSYTSPHYIDQIHIVGKAFEEGADAMHRADVAWLIERIIHDDRGYVFKMTDKEWQEFIGED